MPPLQLRQEFTSLKAFKEALHQWAIEAHFEPRILKSDTGRVRVGCKRDPNCPFVIRCNWERKANREPLARVTVLKEKHTCLNGVEWLNQNAMMGAGNGQALNMGGNVNGGLNGIEIRQDEEGNIVGGARVLGPVEGGRSGSLGQMVPVLPKVQRNSASRLPFLMEILPRLMNITKETTPVEIRECLLREYGAEVHLQQCRRAKTEILKKITGEEEMGGIQTQGRVQGQGPQLNVPSQPRAPVPEMRAPPQQQQNLDGMSEGNDGQQLFGDTNPTLNGNQTQSPFTLSGSGVGTPVIPSRSSTALQTNGDTPVRCPYCINHRWMKTIKDAVEHMSMHVVV